MLAAFLLILHCISSSSSPPFARMATALALAASEPPAKRARLESERAAPMPSGANLIEVDGKSCTHEVAWPPGVH
jgi:hypothetical protein